MNALISVYEYVFILPSIRIIFESFGDISNSNPFAEISIILLDIFNLFNLDYDHLSYQSSNEDKHKSYLQKLIDMGLAFKEKDGPYRFKVDRTNKYFQFQDLILGKVKIPSDDISNSSPEMVKVISSPSISFAVTVPMIV